MKIAWAAFGWIFFGLIMGIGLMRFVSTQEDLSELAAETARPERTADGRLALYFTADDRSHVSAEMLGFLQGLEAIETAIAEEDRQTIRDVTDGLRRGNGQGQAVQAKAPDGFRAIGQSMRQDFSDISGMAMTAEMGEIQLAVSGIMGKCAACHGSYKVVEVKDEAAD
ncbi:hypothetical protein [Hyphomonas sp. GM-8P]|uniref:hypothetical protein n=1 Tax=Hyphomonas sp. GM-8P TaxID=1280945 RepID=UPI000DBFD56E|nr:hypothetical protein [Hyphomonas sp. GM-8P]RAN39916.1 hypothetical protein HY26_14120 [Hyphomonas sp. GM-8P]